jgi:hypothetical protein
LTSKSGYAIIYTMARKIFTSKRERFKVLAENRTNSILNNIRILSHCSNKSLYDYEIDEVDKIFEAIQDALIDAKNKFKDKEKKIFRL